MENTAAVEKAIVTGAGHVVVVTETLAGDVRMFCSCTWARTFWGDIEEGVILAEGHVETALTAEASVKRHAGHTFHYVEQSPIGEFYIECRDCDDEIGAWEYDKETGDIVITERY